MTLEPPSSATDQLLTSKQVPEANTGVTKAPQPSYIKLAMRNMVKKRHISLVHFGLTTIGLLVLLVGLSYLTR